LRRLWQTHGQLLRDHEAEGSHSLAGRCVLCCGSRAGRAMGTRTKNAVVLGVPGRSLCLSLLPPSAWLHSAEARVIRWSALGMTMLAQRVRQLSSGCRSATLHGSAEVSFKRRAKRQCEVLQCDRFTLAQRHAGRTQCMSGNRLQGYTLEALHVSSRRCSATVHVVEMSGCRKCCF